MMLEERSENSLYSEEVQKDVYLIFAIACVVANAIGAISNVFLFGMSVTSIVCFVFCTIAIVGLVIALATNNYFIVITVVSIAIISCEFPFLYFSYREAAIPYFILGLYGATILFNGRLRITVLSALAIIYTAIIIYVFIDPSFYNEVVEVAGDVTLTISSLVAMLVAIITIVFTLLAVLKSYIKQNNECIELNKRLERINHYDILTPCYNRKFIMEYLHMNSAQNSFNGITLVMFNLFELNVINQLYGYSYGDNLLVELAEILFQSLKGRGLVSRFDGTRFVVVLNMTAEEEINKFITEALNSFDAYTQKSKNDLFILSHGYVVCKGVFQVDDKIKEIDNECYNSAAKLKGRSHSDELLYSELRSRNDIHKSNNI